MDSLKLMLGAVDGQVIVYTVLALVPNLFLILWAMARLSRNVRILQVKLDMTEKDINLLDQSISSLTAEMQAIRKIGNEARASAVKAAPGKSA